MKKANESSSSIPSFSQHSSKYCNAFLYFRRALLQSCFWTGAKISARNKLIDIQIELEHRLTLKCSFPSALIESTASVHQESSFGLWSRSAGQSGQLSPSLKKFLMPSSAPSGISPQSTMNTSWVGQSLLSVLTCSSLYRERGDLDCDNGSQLRRERKGVTRGR